MKSILLGALLIAAAPAQDAYAQHGIRKYAQVQTGDMIVPAGTTTSGSVMVIRGNLDVYGNVNGAATAILGDVIQIARSSRMALLATCVPLSRVSCSWRARHSLPSMDESERSSQAFT